MAKKSPARKAAQKPAASAKRATSSKRPSTKVAAAKTARDRVAVRKTTPQELHAAVDSGRGKYVYCVIQSADSRKFGAAGIGDNGSEIHTIHYRDLAAVVSDVPLGILDSTRENVLAHERVNEIVMRDHTVIPMSFGTIFKTKDDIVQLLRSAYDAFGDVLTKMRDKMEFGLKVLWDRDSVVKDIEDEDEGIHRLKNEIASQKGSTYFARMQYGRAIDAALQLRSERYGSEILDRLRDVAVASRINKPIGDKMIMNAAFLVSRDQETAFDTRVKNIASEHANRTFKYTGPWPPYNFVTIRLKLERVSGSRWTASSSAASSTCSTRSLPWPTRRSTIRSASANVCLKRRCSWKAAKLPTSSLARSRPTCSTKSARSKPAHKPPRRWWTRTTGWLELKLPSTMSHPDSVSA